MVLHVPSVFLGECNLYVLCFYKLSPITIMELYFKDYSKQVFTKVHVIYFEVLDIVLLFFWWSGVFESLYC